MHLLHTIKGLMVANKSLKKDIANLVAVSIYMDSIVRQEEIRTGYEVLENLFNGEDYEYLVEEVDILIECFQEDSVNYINARDKAIVFLKANQNIKKELIEVISLIFGSDFEVHRKEQELIDLFKHLGEKKDDDENQR